MSLQDIETKPYQPNGEKVFWQNKGTTECLAFKSSLERSGYKVVEKPYGPYQDDVCHDLQGYIFTDEEMQKPEGQYTFAAYDLPMEYALELNSIERQQLKNGELEL